MAGNRKDVIDTIIANIFRYALVFGLTTHLYDTRKHRLVHSRWAHFYSLTLHVAFVILFPMVYKLRSRPGFYSQTDRHFFEALFTFLLTATFLSIFVSILLQWTSRASAPKLFNEIIRMWQEDIPHLRRSRAIRRQVGRVFLLKTLSTGLVAANAVLTMSNNAGDTLLTSQTLYVFPLFNIIIALGFQFSCGLIFGEYLFRILNYNLALVVEDVRNLCHTRRPPHAFRQRAVLLEKELSEIGRLHGKLQRWVVRLKDMFQVELLFSMTAFFVLQVFMVFVLCVVLYERWIKTLFSHFFIACVTLVVGGLDVTVVFHICSSLLTGCDAAGEILKDLPERTLPCIQLERRVEMICQQLMREKLRLRLCGLFDMNWSRGFIMAESALMYVILLIQLDFKNFGK